MASPDQLAHIKQQLADGVSPEVIRNDLEANAWPEEAIDKALAEAQATANPVQPDSTAAGHAADADTPAAPAANPDSPQQPPASETTNPAPESEAPPKAPTADPDVSSADSPASSKSRRHFPKKLALIIALVLLLVGGGAAAGWLYLNSAGRELQTAAAKLSAVKTLHYEAKATASAKGLNDIFSGGSPTDSSSLEENPKDSSVHTTSANLAVVAPPPGAKATPPPEAKSPDSPVDLVLGVQGAADVSDKQKPKVAATWKLEAQYLKVSVFSASLDTKSIGDTAYFRVANIPPIPFFDLKPIRGQWFKAGPDDLKDFTGQDASQATPKLSDQQSRDLVKAARQSKMVKMKRMKSEQIDGVQASHYRFTIDKEGVKRFIPQANQIIAHKPLSDAETADIAKGFDSFDIKPGDIWIGKQDKLPHKITLGIKAREQDVTSDIILSVSAKDFDKPVKIEAPEKAKSLDEFNKLLTGTSVVGPEGSDKGAQDTQRKNDLNRYKTALGEYAADNAGTYPAQPAPTVISKTNQPYLVLSPKYLETFYDDPYPSAKHYYYVSDGKRFGICADLYAKPGTRIQAGPTTSPQEAAGPASACPLVN